MNHPETRSTDPSVTELMTKLLSQTSRVMRDEIRLARKEFTESAKHAGIGAGLFSGAGPLTLGLGAKQTQTSSKTSTK